MHEGKTLSKGVPSSSTGKSVRKYKAGIKTALDLLSQLGASKSLILGEVLTTKGFYNEAYVAVKAHAASQYWVWLNSSIFSGDAKLKKAVLVSGESICIDTFITGSCLFGDSLVGYDVMGETIPLTDPKTPPTSRQKIVDVKVLGKKHAYELLIHKQLDYLFSVMKSIADKPFTVVFHLPVPEYIMQGIEWYQQDKMTLFALKAYITAVVHRGYMHKMLLRAFMLQAKCHVVICSPLDCLELYTLKEMSLAELETAMEVIDLPVLLEDLKSDAVWAKVLAQEAVTTYGALGYLSYVVHVAQHAKESLKSAVVDISNEKPICSKYEKICASAPAVLGLHYQPAVIPANSVGSWYLTDQQEAALNKLIRQGDYDKAAQQESLFTLMPGR